MNFKIYFNEDEKKKILKSILKNHNIDQQYYTFLNDIYFDTPGNILKKILVMSQLEVVPMNKSIDNINFYIENYINEENPLFLQFACFFIQKFYYELIFNNHINLNFYFQNYLRVIKQIHDMKNYNLNKKNVLTSVKETLLNEAR